MFAWLRPGDLIWNYWVNNYLLGKRPPAFDILFWNSDTTRMTAGLHADFVDLAMDNALTRARDPHGARRADRPRPGSTVDSYVVAGIADHITPWENCYRTTQLFGGTTALRAVHQRPHRRAGQPAGQPEGAVPHQRRQDADAEGLAQGRETPPGHLVDRPRAWLDERCGDLKPAPKRLGTIRLSALAEAPGTYVFDK